MFRRKLKLAGVKIEKDSDLLIIADIRKIFPTGTQQVLETLDNLSRVIAQQTGKQAMILPVIDEPDSAIKVYAVPSDQIQVTNKEMTPEEFKAMFPQPTEEIVEKDEDGK